MSQQSPHPRRDRIARLLVRTTGRMTSASATAAWIRPLMWMRAVLFTRMGGRTREDTYSILVLRLDGVGDVVLTGPLLRRLRRTFPAARICCVVAPHALNVLEECPYIDRVLTFPLPPASRWWYPVTRRMAALSFARRNLWPQSFDLAISPRWGVDRYETAVLAYLSGARIRLGYAEHDPGNQAKRERFDHFLSPAVEDRSVKHDVRRNLDLLSAIGAVSLSDDGLEVWLSDEDNSVAKEISASSRSEPLIALGPGAGGPRRMWPIEKFARVGRWLIEEGYRLVIVGGPDDEALGAELRRLGSQVVDLTNTTTLRQTAAVLRICHLYCGNDAGPMHLAAAVGVPIVEISCHSLRGDELHPNSPMRFGPWRVPHRILRPAEPRDGCARGCRGRTPHCILDVSIDSVMGAIRSLNEEMTLAGGQIDAS
jgi:ADP-heptose:LPS heptosyltransferase